MKQRKLEAVLHEAANHGFKVFHAEPGKKGPQLKGWKERATSDKQKLTNLAETFPEHTFGVLANGVTVIDLDVKPGEGLDGVAAWEAFAEKHSAQSYQTPMRETHGGGRHLYFKGDGLYDRTKKLEGIGEYRTNSDFCVIWRDGKEYPWVNGHGPQDVEFQPVPKWVGTLITKNKTTDFGALHEIWTDDQNSKIHYHSCELFRAGQYKLIVELIMLGKLKRGQIPDLDSENPWTEADILKTVNSAFQATGGKADASNISLAAAWGEPRTAAYALNNPLPEKLCLVEGLIYSQEVSVTFAPPGFLKSLLWLDLGVHVAGGKPWLPANKLEDRDIHKAGTLEIGPLHFNHQVNARLNCRTPSITSSFRRVVQDANMALRVFCDPPPCHQNLLHRA